MKAAAPGKAKTAVPSAAGKAKPAAETAAAKAADIDDIFASKKPKDTVTAPAVPDGKAASKVAGKAKTVGKAEAAPAAPAAEEDDGFADSRGLRNSAWRGGTTLYLAQGAQLAGLPTWMRRGRRRAPLYRGRVPNLHCGGTQDRPRWRYA